MKEHSPGGDFSERLFSKTIAAGVSASAPGRLGDHTESGFSEAVAAIRGQ